MSTPQGTILKILQAFVNALQPLDALLADSDKAKDLLIDIGIKTPVVPQSIVQLRGLVQQLSTALVAVEDLLDNKDELSPEVLIKIKELGEAAASIFSTLERLPAQLETDFAAYPDLLEEIDLEDIVKRLVARLFIEYLKVSNPVFYNTLSVFGVIEVRNIEAGQEYIPAHTQYDIHYDRIKVWLSNPNEALANIYGWGDSNFDYKNLFERLQYLLLSLGYPSTFESIESSSGLDDDNPLNYDAQLHLPIYTEVLENAEVELSALVSPTIPANQVDTGILFTLLAAGQVSVEIELTSNVLLKLGGTFDATGGAGLEVRPPFLVQAVTGPAAGTNANAYFEAEIIVQSDDQNRLMLFEQPGLLKLDISGLALKMGMGLHTESDPTIQIESRLLDGLFAIGVGESDGFLKKILPENGINGPFELGLGWRGDDGIYFVGSGGFELTIPVNASLGPINLESIYIALTITGEDEVSINLNLGVTANAELGPISANIQRVGITSDLSFPDGGGNIGPANIDIGFLPPTGAGFSIDAFVTGGGFLEFDKDNERYAGILALKALGIGITAIGLITTKMPDGSKGFSMLVNIGITFEPPIQISMGFTLSGVGGLIGVNRTMVIHVLQEGVRTGTLDSILFPDPAWVIPNATQVISDLRAVFAPEDGRFVIGPMIRIGYGTPNFIVGEIGVFIELPDPVRIVLLGQLTMSLPTPEAQIIGVNIDIVGVLDFKKQELSFQASINASSLLVFALYGDCAFFLRYGNNPELALAIGGFHPRFPVPAPPAVFAGMRRMGVNISYGPVIHLNCEGYFAITPNSLQLGARVEVFIGIQELDLGVSGFISFDGLVYFSPFSFEVAIAGGMSVTLASISLANIRVYFNLSGPTPWNINGKGVIKVLFIDMDIGFDVTWGRSDKAILQAIDPLPILENALRRTESWGSQLPPTANRVESLVNMEEEKPQAADTNNNNEEEPESPVVVHPAGILEVRQKVTPLDLTLQKYANAPVAVHNHFHIEKLSSGGIELEVEPIREFFSSGQFFKQSNAQKLSAPSFEKLPGGVATKSSKHISVQGKVQSEAIGYESILIKADKTSESPKEGARHLAQPKWVHMRYLNAGNAAAKAALRNEGKARYAHHAQVMVETSEEAYVIANTENLQLKDDIGTQQMTYSQAQECLESYLKEHPNERDSLTVVSEFEVDKEAA